MVANIKNPLKNFFIVICSLMPKIRKGYGNWLLAIGNLHLASCRLLIEVQLEFGNLLLLLLNHIE